MIFKQTPWHFDKFREDAEGEYVKCIGLLVGDWEADITSHYRRSISPHNEQEYGHALTLKVKDTKKRMLKT